VTRDEIVVAVPDFNDPSFDDFVDHFNKRYEFYGRKLRIVKVPQGSPRDQNTEAGPVDAAYEAHAFAFTTFYRQSLDVNVVQTTAARHGMISIIPYANQTTGDTYRDLAPYAWSYPPSADEIERDQGDFTCTSLKGKNAEFARGDLRVKPRRFAVLRSKGDHPLDLAGLNAALRRCSIDPPPVYDIKFNDDRDVALNTYLNMKDKGITSLLLFAHADDVTQWASKLPQDFQPEWITSGLAVPESEAQWHTVMPSTQRAGLLGTFTPNKFLPAADAPAWWAYRENHSEDDPDPTQDRHLYALGPSWHQAYRALLLLASGIQMAGPRLTPETFAQGLQRARFPNPGAGRAPYYQARVGFGPGDYTMTSGSAVSWWSESAPAYSGGGTKGGWCYVRRGARFERDWVDVSSELFDPAPENCR
jgi:hypothetical protein